MKNNNSLARHIYFEYQSSGKLCGLHCLNSLLQGPIFTIENLSDIALKLDEDEKNILKRQKSVHENVDLDGNFNVQVLAMALNQFGIQIIPVNKNKIDDCLKNKKIEAFIFNSSDHWFSLRKIEGVWYDLNSLHKFPKIISEFYLEAFIIQTLESGFTIFTVHNLIELPDESQYLELMEYQKLFTVQEISKCIEQENNEKNKNKNKEKEKEKVDYFKGKGVSINNDSGKLNNLDDDMDDEMKIAMEMSMSIYLSELDNELPKIPNDEDNNAVNITFCFNDMVFTRRVSPNTKISQIKKFVQYHLKTFRGVSFNEPWTKKDYNNDNKEMGEFGIKLIKLYVQII